MFAKYLELYEAYLERMIHLSEGVHLSAQYIHLHESDITNASTYAMWHHLQAFVKSLGSLRELFVEIAFCFSLEEKSFQDPESCARSEFFLLKLQTPTKEDLDSCDFCGPDGAGADKRPKGISIAHNLSPLLVGYDLIQPYILSVCDNVISCENRLVDAAQNGREKIATLVDKIGNPNTYQFSIYAYKLVEGKVVSDEERVLLRHAFVTHILAWNHDLRGAHRGAASLLSTVDHFIERWSAGQAAVQDLIAAMGPQSGTPGGRYIRKPLPVEKNVWEALFNGQGFHDLNTITLESFGEFVHRCRKWSSRGNPDLESFIRCCGVASCLGDEALTSEARLTWARGTWLATKLLTSRLLRTTATGVWVDQVILAILFGLARSGQDRVPVTVEYRTTENVQGEQGEIRKRFFDYCRIVDPEEAGGIWSPCMWQVRSTKSQIAVKWTHLEGRDAMASFVRGGLLRSREEVSHELEVPARLSENDALPCCLGSLSQLVWYLAMQAYPREQGMVWLKQINVTLEVDPFDANSGSSELEVALRCEGLLPRGLRPEGKEGSFFLPLGQLCRCFGQASPNEAGRRLRPGVSARNADEDSDLLVVMSSREAW